MENDADIIAGDFNSSAYRDRGTVGVSSIEEAWEKTLLIPPPDVVPMCAQIKESGDCCGFRIIRRVSRAGELQGMEAFNLTMTRCKLEETAEAAHLLVYIHICEAQTVERIICSETAKSHRKQRGKKRRREKEEGRNWPDAGRADRPW